MSVSVCVCRASEARGRLNKPNGINCALMNLQVAENAEIMMIIKRYNFSANSHRGRLRLVDPIPTGRRVGPEGPMASGS
jgi:hypothetical protein